jgi:class 3 adenylate cyclase
MIASVGQQLTSFLKVMYRSLMNNQDGKTASNIKRQIKVGIAKGPVVAGIVGSEKFCYDVYGDVVNTASRMQSLDRGSILCTEEVYHLFSIATRKVSIQEFIIA